MTRYAYYILPLLLASIILLEHIGVLHIGYLYIKSHELKWTNLDYNYYPRNGDIFTAGESVSNNNYEDAILAFQPDYKVRLQKDLLEIAQNRDHIDSINGSELSFYSDKYMVKACLDKRDISINDSTIFKKLVNVEILGQYQLYDAEGCELLYHKEGEKFWIRDKIIIRGFAREEFINNKINEIWLAQMSNNAHHIVSQFEQPYYYRSRIKALKAVMLPYVFTAEELLYLDDKARMINFELDRIARNGSRIYGHIDDPSYEARLLRERLDREQEYRYDIVDRQSF